MLCRAEDNAQGRDPPGREAPLGCLPNSEMAIQVGNVLTRDSSNAGPGLIQTHPTAAAGAGSALHGLTEKCSLAPGDLAPSRQIFYRKIEFYCTVNTI